MSTGHIGYGKYGGGGQPCGNRKIAHLARYHSTFFQRALFLKRIVEGIYLEVLVLPKHSKKAIGSFKSPRVLIDLIDNYSILCFKKLAILEVPNYRFT